MKKKTFEVLIVSLYGEDWSEAATIEAFGHGEAAEEFCSKDDIESGEYSCLEDGRIGPVLVREEGADEVQSFTVDVWSTIEYSATRNEK